MSDQSDLRRQKQSARRTMAKELRREAAENIANRIISSDVFLRAKHIGCYLAWGAEVDVSAIIEQIWVRNKSCYLPVLIPAHQNRLWFAPFDPNTQLVANQFGIYEPIRARKHRVAAQRLDLVIIPLVAFDRHGTRVGMGGGYYDRTFAFRRTRQVWLRPTLVGVAYECQKTATIATNRWDVRLDAVVTDKNIYIPSSTSTAHKR